MHRTTAISAYGLAYHQTLLTFQVYTWSALFSDRVEHRSVGLDDRIHPLNRGSDLIRSFVQGWDGLYSVNKTSQHRDESRGCHSPTVQQFSRTHAAGSLIQAARRVFRISRKSQSEVDALVFMFSYISTFLPLCNGQVGMLDSYPMSAFQYKFGEIRLWLLLRDALLRDALRSGSPLSPSSAAAIFKLSPDTYGIEQVAVVDGLAKQHKNEGKTKISRPFEIRGWH